MDRPIPFDYLVLLWAAVPWLWTDASILRRRWAVLSSPRAAWRRLRRLTSARVWTRGG
jgi:hypothetical protein